MSEEVAVSLHLVWSEQGHLSLSPSRKLAFPKIPSGPGVYRFSYSSGSKLTVYVGESGNLGNRFNRDYRYNPQAKTSVWVREWLLGELALSTMVSVSILDSSLCSLVIGGRQISVDFGRKSDRLLFENAAIFDARSRGCVIKNKPGVSEHKGGGRSGASTTPGADVISENQL